MGLLRSLQDRRVVITGASSGVGRALALRLAPYHPRLLVTARNEAQLRELASQVSQSGAEAVEVLAGDVTDPAALGQLVKFVADEWGGLDILVNNAGVSAHGRFADGGEETLRRIMEVNFFAATELTRQLIPSLRNGNDSLIVNVGSVLGHRAIPFNSEYCASKFALRGWSESLRAELNKVPIAVLMVSPGTIDTEFFDHMIFDHKATPWASQKGVSVDAVARQMVRAMRWRRHEIYPNWRAHLLVWINRLCPGLVDRVLNLYG